MATAAGIRRLVWVLALAWACSLGDTCPWVDVSPVRRDSQQAHQQGVLEMSGSPGVRGHGSRQPGQQRRTGPTGVPGARGEVSISPRRTWPTDSDPTRATCRASFPDPLGCRDAEGRWHGELSPAGGARSNRGGPGFGPRDHSATASVRRELPGGHARPAGLGTTPAASPRTACRTQEPPPWCQPPSENA